jgi:hypothetical protein
VVQNNGAESWRVDIGEATKVGATVEPNGTTDWAPKAGDVEPNGWLLNKACVCPDADEPNILACGCVAPNPPTGDAGFRPNTGAPAKIVQENQKILKKEVTHKEITLMRIEKSLLKEN